MNRYLALVALILGAIIAGGPAPKPDPRDQWKEWTPKGAVPTQRDAK